MRTSNLFYRTSNNFSTLSQIYFLKGFLSKWKDYIYCQITFTVLRMIYLILELTLFSSSYLLLDIHFLWSVRVVILSSFSFFISISLWENECECHKWNWQRKDDAWLSESVQLRESVIYSLSIRLVEVLFIVCVMCLQCILILLSFGDHHGFLYILHFCRTHYFGLIVLHGWVFLYFVVWFLFILVGPMAFSLMPM